MPDVKPPAFEGICLTRSGRVIVEPLGMEGQTSGGVFVSRNSKHPRVKGIILFVGHGSREDIEEGDFVFYKRYAGDPITHGGRTWEVFNEADIVSRLEWDEKDAPHIIPLGSRVIVQPEQAEEVTEGGIVLPGDRLDNTPQKGVATAVGLGRLRDDGSREEIGAAVGDTVYFRKYSGMSLEVDGKKYLLLEAGDLLGVEA